MNLPYMPVDLSTHGAQLDRLNVWVHVLMALLFVGWGFFFIYTLIRFNARRHAKADYDGVKSHASSYLELGVALFEAVLLFGLSIPLWADWVNVEDKLADGNAVHLRVIAQQFAWNVHYPGPDGLYGRLDPKLVTDNNLIGLDQSEDQAKDDIVLSNVIVVPKGRPVRIELTTKDVIHSFFLPSFRVKQDTMPGESIPVMFEATTTSLDYLKMEAEANPSKHRRILARDRFYDAGNKENPKTQDQLLKEVEDVYKSPTDVVRIVKDLEIACAQLCGGQHYRMRGNIHIVDDATWASINSPSKLPLWVFMVQRFHSTPPGAGAPDYPGPQ